MKPCEEPIPVTVVVPVRNEEFHLARSLPLLRDFAAVIVVDSASTDRTHEVAVAAGATVLQFAWDGRFPKKRNWALRTITFQTPWVLFLDADELVTTTFTQELRAALGHTSHAGFWIEFDNHFLGRCLRHGHQMRKLCLFRIGAGEYETIFEERWSSLDMEVHEHPVISGSVGRVRARLGHDDVRDFGSHVRKHEEYSSWEARRYLSLKQLQGGSWLRLTMRQRRKYRNLGRWWLAPAYFFGAYVWRLGFLDGSAGLQFATFKAFYFWQIRVKILEAQRRQERILAEAHK